MFSFTGSRGSILGDHNFYGKGAITFNTQWKTVTSNWKLVEQVSLKRWEFTCVLLALKLILSVAGDDLTGYANNG